MRNKVKCRIGKKKMIIIFCLLFGQKPLLKLREKGLIGERKVRATNLRRRRACGKEKS